MCQSTVPPILSSSSFLSTAYVYISAMSIKPSRTRSTGITIRFRDHRNRNARVWNGPPFHQDQRSTTTVASHHLSGSGGTTNNNDDHTSHSTTSEASGSMVRMTLQRRATTGTSRTQLLHYLQEALDILDDVTLDNENCSN